MINVRRSPLCCLQLLASDRNSSGSFVTTLRKESRPSKNRQLSAISAMPGVITGCGDCTYSGWFELPLPDCLALPDPSIFHAETLLPQLTSPSIMQIAYIPQTPVQSYLSLTLRRLNFSIFDANMLSIPSAVLQIILMLALAKSSEYFNERTFHCFIGEVWSLPLLAALLALPARGHAWGRFALTTMVSGCKSRHLFCLCCLFGKHSIRKLPLPCCHHIPYPVPSTMDSLLRRISPGRPLFPPHPLRLDLGKLLQREETRADRRHLQRHRTDRLVDRIPDLPRR